MSGSTDGWRRRQHAAPANACGTSAKGYTRGCRRVEASELADRIRANFISVIPLGRMGRAEEVANAALFLASDESRFVAGADLVVDGGMGAV